VIPENPDNDELIPSPAGPPDWMPEAVHGSWDFLSNYPLVLPATLVVVGIALAVVARGIVIIWSTRLTSRTPTDLDTRFFRILANLAALVIAYAFLVAAVTSLGLGEFAETTIIRMLMSLLVLQLMRSAMRASNLGLEILSRVRNRFAIIEERTIPLFDLVFTVLIVAIAAYALLQVWDIDPTAWLASAGIIGIAVGFAARDTLANLFAGFFIIADTPYKLGDYIVLDTGERGEVTRVGIRSTRLLTRDDVEITIPNSEMATTKVINESGGRWEKFRIRIKVGVAYGSNIKDVVDLLQKVADEHDEVCKDPNPRIRMRGFGDSSLDFEMLCWILRPADRGRVSHELYMIIYDALNEAGVEIPFPQRDLWLKQVPEQLENKPAAGK